MRKQTIKKSVSAKGLAIHSGLETEITFKPAPENAGIIFVRADLDSSPEIPAQAKYVSDTKRGVSLKIKDIEVKVVEHVLAALGGLGIDNVKIEIKGPEPPVLDGSALPYVKLLREAGIIKQKEEKSFLKLALPLEIKDENKVLKALPYDGFKTSFMVNFPGTVIGRQELTFEGDAEAFEKEISPARTFGFREELESLIAAGLAKGASLENALGISKDGYINEPRFPDEVVRHKTLDLIGDLMLLGLPLKAYIIAKDTGHKYNIELVKRIRMEAEYE